MAVKYLVKPKRNVINGNNEVKYYPVPAHAGTVDLALLAERLSEESTLTSTDVHAALIGLSHMIEKYLHNGYSVKLDQLGTFSLSITGDGFDTAADCTPKKVKANKICFRASVALKKNLKHVQFERK